MAAEFDARRRNESLTYQGFLRTRLAALKKLALKLSEDAAKSACLLEAFVWEADKHLKVHRKRAAANDLSARLEQLERRMVGELRCLQMLLRIGAILLTASCWMPELLSKLHRSSKSTQRQGS